MKVGLLTIMSLVCLVALPSPVIAQPVKIRFHKEPYFLDSGVHDGLIGPGAETFAAFRDVIQVSGAPWLRLQFQAFNLDRDSEGANLSDSATVLNDTIRSFITITSLEDGGRQILDAISLKQWRNTSAYFNGDAVEIELHLAPGDKGIFFQISDIYVGEKESEMLLDKTLELCGTDDRVSSNDPAVGRVLAINWGVWNILAYCTGWLTSNGAHLTAGHCIDIDVPPDGIIDMDILEFNVRASNSNGTPNFSHPNDQYSVDQGNIDFNDDGAPAMGNDWAVFDCYPNSNTGLLPVQAQQAFYRMSRDDDPDNVRVTGYGTDSTPPGSGGGRNSDSQTQQTDSGPFLDEDIQGASDVVIEYVVDTEGGNSGGPVIVDGTTLTIGIHTNAGCDPPNNGNHGTGFEHDALESAIQNFPGSNVEYADKDHPVTQEDGTIFRPYDTVAEAVTAVTTGDIISIVTGFYNETITINKAMTITAPVGMVTIGASGLGKLLAGSPVVAASAPEDTAGNLIPTAYALSPAYPNPFKPLHHHQLRP